MFQRSPTKGLLTAVPPVQVPPDASPDLDNTLMRNGAVRKRGGMTPMFRDRMLLNAIRNVGYGTTSRTTNAAGSGDGAFRIVPGMMVAGHRHIYEALTALSFDLFFEVGDLTSLHGGNSVNGGGVDHDGAPYTVKVRPILSKGPVKRSDQIESLFGNAQITWNTTIATMWGTDANSGMPFCLYLFNNGTGSAPSWQFRLSAHVLVAGNWTLQTVTSGVIPATGGLYHIVGACSGSRVALRVARIYGVETPTYTANETTFTGTLAWNKCPIQVFDCPQQFIDATNVGGANQRPGLNLNATTATGGYWFASMRAEGRIEDIAIWSTDKFASVVTTLDRQTKLDQAHATSLIDYWSMTEKGTDYVQEMTGRGNHLFMSPRGPIFDGTSGGKDGASWFFNGQTAYVLIDANTHNWRYADGTNVSSFHYAVRNNKPHGMAVEFWVDSVEPQFESVVAEIHGVMRMVITTTGLIRVYVRDGGGAAGSAQSTGINYQLGLDSTVTVRPGNRYSVAALRVSAGTSLVLYVNGVADATSGAINACNADARPPGGITLGMGGYEAMIRAATPDGTDIAAINNLNTDQRSAFVGRIESFKILCGAATLTPGGSILATPTYKPESSDDWRYPESLAWVNLAAGRTNMQAADVNDTIRNVGAGSVFLIEGHSEAGVQTSYLISDSTTSPQIDVIARATRDDANTALGRFGHNSLIGVGARVFHAFAYYRLNVNDKDDEYPGNYVRGLEYRYNGGTPTVFTNVQNTQKHVHIQFSAATDSVGLLAGVQRRCAENDLFDESDNAVFTQPQSFSYRQRPYGFRSPREIGVRWAQGIAKPLPGTVPVTMIADWQVQTDGRRFLITAAGRQVYWGHNSWEIDGPFANVALPVAVASPGENGGHIFARATSSQLNFTGTASKSTVVFECWLKPDRLDGRRMIAAKLTPATSQSQVSWFVSTQDGSIEVQGTLGGGVRTWGFSEGSGSGTAILRRTQSLRVGAWNHLHVTMNTAGVTVRVNGQLISMLDLSALTGSADRRDAHTSAAGDTPTNELYLCGLPPGRQDLSLAVVASASTVTLTAKAWAGLISEVRIRNAEDTTNWPTGADGFPPIARYLDDANTYLLIHCDEASGWFLDNEAALSTGDNAEIKFVEFVPLAEGLEETGDGRYDWVVFRDTLIFTNGEDHPKRISYDGRYAATPFRVENLGVRKPSVSVSLFTEVGGGGGSTIAPATYQVYVSFLTKNDTESEPAFLFQDVLATGQTSLVLRADWLPRSDDPQVIGRRLYVSPPGGGTPVFNRDIGNDGFQHDVFVYPSGGEGVLIGERLEAPRARLVSLAGAALVLANLTDEPAGQNAFAFAQPSEPSYFTTASTVLVDSRDGKPIVGIATNLTAMFLSKRDSIYTLQVGAVVNAIDVEAAIAPVNNSDGVGGGTVAAENALFGAGDRGVFAFNNTDVRPMSANIEPTWRDVVDRDDEGIFLMRGAYHRPNSEYWLSLSLRGELALNTILVFALDEPGISKLTVPEHRTLAPVGDPARQNSLIAIGTMSGRIWFHNEQVFVDGSDDGALANGAQTLDGSAGLSGSSTSLTMSGANFVTAGGGLAGVHVSLVHDGVTEDRVIARNTSDTLFWTDPLTGWTAYTSFVVGGYTGRWSSPWITTVEPNRGQAAHRIALEFVPIDTNVTVRLASIRQTEAVDTAFPTTATRYEEFTRNSKEGWIQDQPVPRSHREGHYHRIEVRTDGIRAPFALVGYGLDITGERAPGHAGRTT